MSVEDSSDGSLSAAERERVVAALEEAPVSFAVLFGSAGRGEMTEESDLDIAVEFDGLRSSDGGDYNDVYFSLRGDLSAAVSRSVDLVDVHSMSPAFARAALTGGAVLVGEEADRERLVDELAGELPTVEEGYKRVAAAAERLRQGE